ncbi:MAG: hypothetical protein FWE31_03380 [Firmicutes bacterium]|nr:hypothetical protein [Bacillota bacterium]
MSEILKRFDDAFGAITKQTVTIKTQVFPNTAALDTQEKLDKILEATNKASKERYLSNNNHEAILARLIMQIYSATDQETEETEVFHKSDSFFEILTSNKETELDKVFSGFEFYENNPYREIAEKRLAKIKRKRYNN